MFSFWPRRGCASSAKKAGSCSTCAPQIARLRHFNKEVEELCGPARRLVSLPAPFPDAVHPHLHAVVLDLVPPPLRLLSAQSVSGGWFGAAQFEIYTLWGGGGARSSREVRAPPTPPGTRPCPSPRPAPHSYSQPLCLSLRRLRR